MKKCIGWIITTMLLPFVLAGFIYQLAEYAFIFGKQMADDSDEYFWGDKP